MLKYSRPTQPPHGEWGSVDKFRGAGSLDVCFMHIGQLCFLPWFFFFFPPPCHSCSMTQCFHTFLQKNNLLHKSLVRNVDFSLHLHNVDISTSLQKTEGFTCETTEGVTLEDAQNLTPQNSHSAQSLLWLSAGSSSLSLDLFPAKPLISSDPMSLFKNRTWLLLDLIISFSFSPRTNECYPNTSISIASLGIK